jgi:dTDP-4-dehydrorhamnose 3,5-epimerase
VTLDGPQTLILGAGGQLGSALRERLPRARALGSAALDIADATAVAAFDWSGVQVLLNAAAYTDVDGAETQEGRLAAWRVNGRAVANLAAVALRHDLTLVHLSTDYVFDGTRDRHREDEPVAPLGVYGQSKAAGELAVGLVPRHYLIRTSWVIGEGRNFVRTMVGLGSRGISPTVVSDQVGRPAFCTELAAAIEHLVASGAPSGTYHVSNGGEPVSWAELTREIFRLAGFTGTVSDTTTRQYFADKPAAAPRPLASTFALDKLRATGFEPADWRPDLQHYVTKELAAMTGQHR